MLLSKNDSSGWRVPTLVAVGAAGLGAGLMYLLDPDTGRRRRKVILQRTGRVSREAGAGAARVSRDIQHRTRGVLATLRRVLRRDEATGEQLAARVRARLGRVVSHPHAIDVSVEDGRVVLAGPILAQEVKAALEEAERVPGVDRVDNEMDAFDRPENIPALQGGSTRTGPRSELMQSNWTPGVRLLTAASGGALLSYGIRRRDAVGAGLGMAGAALTAGALVKKRRAVSSVRA